MTSFEMVMALLRNALWGEELPAVEASDIRWDKVFGIASDQGVQTIIYDALRPGCAPTKVLMSRWAVDTARAEAVAERISKIEEELSALWDKNCIEYATMKGVSIAKLYPHPNHRLSGDIDYYFPNLHGWEMANKIARRLSDTEKDNDGDMHYVWRGVVVEHHLNWHHLSSKQASQMQAHIQDHVLTPEDDLLMLYSNILRQAMIGGAGLRQLADLAVAARTYNGKYDKRRFGWKLMELGLEDWSGLLSSALYVAFGVPRDELPIVPDSTYLNDFMDLILSDGNPGKRKNHRINRAFKRFQLFSKVCPKEYFARWTSLRPGQKRKNLKNNVK